MTSRRTRLLLLAITAVLFAMQANLTLHKVTFGGDAGYRIAHADSIVVAIGQRTWLPALQAHIWALHRADAPLWAYRLIGPFYFAIAVFALG